ncbi:hypothetical protein VSR01_25275 [Actinacidiphila sp. DG2A-62]|nr:hypothetical protein [Actinacidiphila sp. DG2A-62]MEC3996639.1 hypothetical protein [Actinacidiphila sp. DG2A-62]
MTGSHADSSPASGCSAGVSPPPAGRRLGRADQLGVDPQHRARGVEAAGGGHEDEPALPAAGRRGRRVAGPADAGHLVPLLSLAGGDRDGVAGAQLVEVVEGAAVAPLAAHDDAGAGLAGHRGVPAVAGPRHEHPGGGALEDHLAQADRLDVQDGHRGAAGHLPAVVVVAAHRRGAEREFGAQPAVAALLGAGVLDVAEHGQVHHEAEQQRGQHGQRRAGDDEPQVGARSRGRRRLGPAGTARRRLGRLVGR